ncbi:TetR/AcrR family transcriptional regulator [Janibacter sp. Soil728]|uniref:TetR/AcrR family transcriptional regulator n=1 Tax=Janibacter sp. Soil728 TaxID=1736393 RepID=UPI000AE791B9|nr:TetR/AcrR family transcriptional regulator [Janibacter sp. Soil728]
MSDIGTKGVARADRRRQLVGEAVEALGREGYARSSMADVARRAGVSKAMVHNVFGSKADLALACLEEVGPGLIASIAAAQTASDPGQRAQETFTAIFSAMADHRHAWALINDETLPEGSAAAARAMELRVQLRRMGTVGTRDVLSGAGLTDPLDHDLLDRLWESIVATAVTWWEDHEDHSAQDMAARLARLLGVVTLAR